MYVRSEEMKSKKCYGIQNVIKPLLCGSSKCWQWGSMSNGDCEILRSLSIREIEKYWSCKISPEVLRRHFRLKWGSLSMQLYKIC